MKLHPGFLRDVIFPRSFMEISQKKHKTGEDLLHHRVHVRPHLRTGTFQCFHFPRHICSQEKITAQDT